LKDGPALLAGKGTQPTEDQGKSLIGDVVTEDEIGLHHMWGLPGSVPRQHRTYTQTDSNEAKSGIGPE